MFIKTIIKYQKMQNVVLSKVLFFLIQETAQKQHLINDPLVANIWGGVISPLILHPLELI